MSKELSVVTSPLTNLFGQFAIAMATIGMLLTLLVDYRVGLVSFIGIYVVLNVFNSVEGSAMRHKMILERKRRRKKC